MSSELKHSKTPTPDTAHLVSKLEHSSQEGALPLSFPAILRNPGFQPHFARLGDPHRTAEISLEPRKPARRNDNEGKRWIRRNENARFVGNPHVVAPSKRDLQLSHSLKSETFPVPLPPFLPRSVSLPSAAVPAVSPQTSHAGHFSLSLKGARKNIRRAGPRTQALVRAVERELASWIAEGDVVFDPDAPPAPMTFPGSLIGDIEGIYEVQRTAGQLVWWIQDDAWARYVIHCCARYHEVVSFSKDTSTYRLTYLLRPDKTRLIKQDIPNALATPPTTDPELSSDLSSYDSDVLGLSDIASSIALSDIASNSGLSDAEEEHLPATTLHSVVSDGEADAESDPGESIASLLSSALQAASLGSESGDRLHSAMQNISVSDDNTPRARRLQPLRTSAWDRARSGSSPSPSPVRRDRRPPRRAKRGRGLHQRYEQPGKKSFHDYLFS